MLNKEKPIIEINKLENTVINTKTADEFNNLMRIYELAGWNWVSGENPTNNNIFGLWEIFGKNTTVTAYDIWVDKEGFGYKDKKIY